MSIPSEDAREEGAPVVGSNSAPMFLFKFHTPLSLTQVEFFRQNWDDAAREGRPFGIGPDVDLYQLVDGRYVAVTADEVVVENDAPGVRAIREREAG
jgi:hypothetical protein